MRVKFVSDARNLTGTAGEEISLDVPMRVSHVLTVLISLYPRLGLGHLAQGGYTRPTQHLLTVTRAGEALNHAEMVTDNDEITVDVPQLGDVGFGR
jgi:hypothetical protein